jgi:MerR family transcriptional regulator, thiopeptide resistance regulator
MLTISRLARRFGLSRSTLLYYDSIGLLRPSGRSEAGYRIYSPQDAARMEQIDLYRKAGLTLADIARVLSADRGTLAAVLETRLRGLGAQIQALRRQQQVLVDLLRGKNARRRARSLDKQGWVAILRASGLSEDDMRRWHVEFEASAPEAHQDFLESLGISADEVSRIRRWSQQRPKPRPIRRTSPGRPNR